MGGSARIAPSVSFLLHAFSVFSALVGVGSGNDAYYHERYVVMNGRFYWGIQARIGRGILWLTLTYDGDRS